ncbi:MAG: cupredoxin domain-containing protein [Thermomicrobiales bacterium]
MHWRMLAIMVLIAGVMAFVAPARAGGWATVVLDEDPPVTIYAGETLTLGFTVKQHDVTPVNVDRAWLQATHRETEQEITADARQNGPVGHYLVEFAFPSPGSWKWMITPDPFAGTAFGIMTILAPGTAPSAAFPEAPSHPAHIHAGSCASLGEVVAPLEETGSGLKVGEKAGDWAGAETASPVAASVTMVAMPLAQILAGAHAINVHLSEQEMGTYVACGDIGGQMLGDDLLVGLQPLNGAGDAGVAVLHADGEQTVVTLYTFVVAAPATSASTATIRIAGAGAGTGAGAGSGMFDPPMLEVTAGTTVTWVNESDIPHNVIGETLDFDDSGMLDPGERHSITFDTPGAYTYVCSPHPWMSGTVVVT